MGKVFLGRCHILVHLLRSEIVYEFVTLSVGSVSVHTRKNPSVPTCVASDHSILSAYLSDMSAAGATKEKQVHHVF